MSTESPAVSVAQHQPPQLERDETTPVCRNAQVAVSNWSVTFANEKLWTRAQLTPAEGWSLAHVAIAVTDVDIVATYCLSTTACGDGATGTVDVSATTVLFDPRQHGDTVTGVVSGWLWGPDGQRCSFWNQETFTV